ncbi:hypothetical protein CDAR_93921 [Caerostris darwini]|uniref:Uncharacterized protein n=1 Tax=Caerostris darwini TaxID=1538125 RepID=A0AAV4NK67_9ARAC|nr:hypothetical protein CDAR_93921 [Caerostris darwini]
MEEKYPEPQWTRRLTVDFQMDEIAGAGVHFELFSQYAPVGKFMANFDAEIYAIYLAIKNLKIRVNNDCHSKMDSGFARMGKHFSLLEGTVIKIKKIEGTVRKSVCSGTKLCAVSSSYTKDIVKEKMEKALLIWIEDISQKKIAKKSTSRWKYHQANIFILLQHLRRSYVEIIACKSIAKTTFKERCRFEYIASSLEDKQKKLGLPQIFLLEGLINVSS